MIPVSISIDGRGSASKYSIICLPKLSDFKRYQRKRNTLDSTPIFTESIQIDANEKLRKQLRRKHIKLLKRLRQRRVRIKRKYQETSQRKVRIIPSRTATIVIEQLKIMRELWLPTTQKYIRKQCSRDVFGYLTQCQFDFIAANVTGIGYVTSRGLEALGKIKSNRKYCNKVLIRDPNSLHYRFATIQIR